MIAFLSISKAAIRLGRKTSGLSKPCHDMGTFCWYGSDIVSDPEVTANGRERVHQGKDEKPFEWVTEVRCVQVLHTCIVARNQKLVFGDGTQTDIDLYKIKEWSNFQIRATLWNLVL